MQAKQPSRFLETRWRTQWKTGTRPGRSTQTALGASSWGFSRLTNLARWSLGTTTRSRFRCLKFPTVKRETQRSLALESLEILLGGANKVPENSLSKNMQDSKEGSTKVSVRAEATFQRAIRIQNKGFKIINKIFAKRKAFLLPNSRFLIQWLAKPIFDTELSHQKQTKIIRILKNKRHKKIQSEDVTFNEENGDSGATIEDAVSKSVSTKV